MTRAIAALTTLILLLAGPAGCSLRDGTVHLDVRSELPKSVEADCRGPSRVCRLSYSLTIANDGPPGFYQYRCDVEALNDAGRVVLGTTLTPVSRQETLGAGQPPYENGGILSVGRILWPKVRRSITSLSGTCDAFVLRTGAATY